MVIFILAFLHNNSTLSSLMVTNKEKIDSPFHSPFHYTVIDIQVFLKQISKKNIMKQCPEFEERKIKSFYLVPLCVTILSDRWNYYYFLVFFHIYAHTKNNSSTNKDYLVSLWSLFFSSLPSILFLPSSLSTNCISFHGSEERRTKKKV